MHRHTSSTSTSATTFWYDSRSNPLLATSQMDLEFNRVGRIFCFTYTYPNTKFYANDFTSGDQQDFHGNQTSILVMCVKTKDLKTAKNMCDLSVMLVKEKKHEHYYVVFLGLC